MKYKLTKAGVREFLISESVMTAAVADPGGKPISTVLLFAIDPDYTMYCATHRDSYKAEAMLANPRLGWSVWRNKELLVQADMQVEEVVGDEVGGVLDKLVNATENVADFWPPVLRIAGDDYVVFRLKPIWVRAMELSSPKVHDMKLPQVEWEEW